MFKKVQATWVLVPCRIRLQLSRTTWADPLLDTVRVQNLEVPDVSSSPQKWTDFIGHVENPEKLVPSSLVLGVRRTDLVPWGEVRAMLMSPRLMTEVKST